LLVAGCLLSIHGKGIRRTSKPDRNVLSAAATSQQASGHLTMHFIIIKRMMDDEYEAI